VGVNSGRRLQQHRVRLSANVLLNLANLLLTNFTFSNIQQYSATFSNIQQHPATVSKSIQLQQNFAIHMSMSETFSSVAQAQAVTCPRAMHKKNVHAHVQTRLPDLPAVHCTKYIWYNSMVTVKVDRYILLLVMRGNIHMCMYSRRVAGMKSGWNVNGWESSHKTYRRALYGL
jgi:hypothetical protein